MRRQSSRSVENAPSLPRDGAQHMAKKLSQAMINNNNNFMATPVDPGQAGYVLY